MAKKSKVPHGAKAAFVRANPKMAPAELVKQGKKQGLSLTVGHIYNIRATDKAKKKTTPPSQPSVESSTQPSTSAEELSRMDAQLRSLILSMGLYRAKQVFSQLESSLSRIA
jgi:hypothetical protein